MRWCNTEKHHKSGLAVEEQLLELMSKVLEGFFSFMPPEDRSRGLGQTQHLSRGEAGTDAARLH